MHVRLFAGLCFIIHSIRLYRRQLHSSKAFLYMSHGRFKCPPPFFYRPYAVCNAQPFSARTVKELFIIFQLHRNGIVTKCLDDVGFQVVLCIFLNKKAGMKNTFADKYFLYNKEKVMPLFVLLTSISVLGLIPVRQTN